MVKILFSKEDMIAVKMYPSSVTSAKYRMKQNKVDI